MSAIEQPPFTARDTGRETRIIALEMAVRSSVSGAADYAVMASAHEFAHYIDGTNPRHADRCAYRTGG
jgi:hypothetical protein